MDYMHCKQQDLDGNTFVIMANQLMGAALKMYQTKLQCKTWEEDPAECKEVINLAAQFNAFKKKFNNENRNKVKKQQQSGQKHLPAEEWHKMRYDETS
jgi:hypothetical protein